MAVYLFLFLKQPEKLAESNESIEEQKHLTDVRFSKFQHGHMGKQMKEKYNFYEALAIVVGTDRRIKQEYKNDWSRYIHFTNGKGAFLGTKNIKWWPNLSQQKEKAWEVEPEEQPERWKFKGSGVFGVAPGEIIIKTQEGRYEKEEDSLRIPTEIFEGCPQWFERIEPAEAEEPKEIIVWGACDGSGLSFIYDKEPNKKDREWITDRPLNYLRLKEKNLFPKDKPVKIKLVLFDD